ncbi:MAG TPA: hypothetical protein DCQ04_13320 [Actinobacteria bacterium]|nr:hypothetical protein [Actinomycetota bacterium]
MTNIQKCASGVLILAVAVALWPAHTAAQGCASANPGAGWVCINGGWLPPGHPGIPTAPPTPIPPTAPPMPSSTLAYGPGFPMGEIVEFVPPLRLAPSYFPDLLVNGQYQPGRQRLTVTGAGKVFRPVPTPGYTGPLVIIESLGSMTVPLLNSTATFVVQDLTIQGLDPSQPCIQVQAHSVVLERVVTADCAGVDVRRAVDVQIIDSLFARGTRGLWLRGEGPSGLDGPNSVTHTRIASTRFEGFIGPEVILVSHGLGIVFDRVVVQGNHGAALRVQRSADWPSARIEGIVVRDTWMEANGGGIIDPLGVVRVEGVTGTW